MSLLYSVVTPPAITPVSVFECRDDSRVDFHEEDELIVSYIESATAICSEIVGKKLINETIKYSIQSPNSDGGVAFPFMPVSSIVEIQYYDTNNVSQVLDVNDFYLYNFDQESVMIPKTDVIWPSCYNRRDSINITFVAGFGDTKESVPAAIRKAIRLLVAHWFENRTAVLVGVNAQDIPYGVQNLLGVERVGWVG